MSYTSWDNIQQTLFRFLKGNMNSRQGVLLGLSGGPDSICLYHALLEYRKSYGISFAIAHIDHGWREESRYEVEILNSLAIKDGIPFYCKCLSVHECSTEEAARNARFQFFQEICKSLDMQAVLLAHHADDQAETVIKRLFEGASLGRLCGMRPITKMDSLTLWRPFLSISKKEILDAANKKGFVHFYDRTNADPKFLRARMRQSLIPHLSSVFGKEISLPLASLASEASELTDYLDAHIQPFLSLYSDHGLGGYLDLSGEFPEPIFLKHLIRRICQKEEIVLSRSILEQICQSLIQNTANQKFIVKLKKILIDRRRIFIPKIELKLPHHEAPLLCGTMEFGPWVICIEKAFPKQRMQSTFSEVWKGYGQISLPEGNYTLRKALPKDVLSSGKRLAKFWTDRHVPAFLRSQAPVITASGTVFQEFLSGHTACFQGEMPYLITLKLK